MPEDAVASPDTKLATEIKVKTETALSEVGLSKTLDADFDAALKRDQNNEPKPTADTSPAKKTDVAGDGSGKEGAGASEEQVPDIPDAALKTEKEKAEADRLQQREKDIAEQTKGMSKSAAQRFRDVEKRAWEAEQRAEKLAKIEAEAAQWKAKYEAPNEEFIKLKEEYAKMDEAVKQTNLINHPKFKAAFDTPIAYKLDEIKKLAGSNGDSLAELLEMPEGKIRNEKLSEFMEGIEDEFSKLNVIGAIRELDVLKKGRATELANWKENSARLGETEKKRAEEAAAMRKTQVEQAVKSTIARVTHPEKGLELYREVEGNDEWNKKVQERISSIQKIVNAELTTGDIAEMAAAAVSAPEYRRLFLAQRSLVNKLKAQIKELSGAEPGITPATEIDPKRYNDKESWVNAVIKSAEKDGLLRG